MLSFNTPISEGLYGLLLSPGKGLFIFSPVIILGIIGLFFFKPRSWTLLILSLSLMFIISHSTYSVWSSGGGWGPRFLLPIIPLLILPMGITFRLFKNNSFGKMFLIVIIALSILIQILSVSANWARHLQSIYVNSNTPKEYIMRMQFSWTDAPIWGQINSITDSINILRDDAARATIDSIISSIRETSGYDSQVEIIRILSLNVPDFWFIYFGFLGVPVIWLMVIGSLLFSVLIFSTTRLRNIENLSKYELYSYRYHLDIDI
jgi:hypothetical protein